ncbi:hypothetical protein [Nitratifractor sp.]
MKLSLHIEADARKIGLYNLDLMDLEGIDNADYDFHDREDLERYIDDVDALVSSGEFDVLEESTVFTVLDPENVREMTLSIDEGTEESLSPEECVYNNLSPDSRLKCLERAEEGQIFYLRSERGEGFWDLSLEREEETAEPEKLECGYFDCAETLDTYDLLRESYYDYLCDTILPEKSSYAGTPFQVDSFQFRPSYIRGALFRVVTDPVSGAKALERLPVPDRIFLDESADL